MTPATIVVIEDNPATRRMVRFALERRGYTVLEAPDARSAARLLDENAPDLVLYDVGSSGTIASDGLTDLRLRSNEPRAVFVALTTHLAGSNERPLLAAGFDDVIVKPVDPASLLSIVETHLAWRASDVERFGGGRRVLVADADPLALKLVRFRLAGLGFEVEVASDGEQAIAAARTTKPDAIVSNVMLPKVDGFGVALAVRQDPELRDVPVVLFASGTIEPADRDIAKRAGASDLVARTPCLAEVLAALRTAFARSGPITEVPPESLPDLQRARARRVVQQLERQVHLNASLARRVSALSAELTVLAGISDAVLRHHSIEDAIDETLAACFDAGGISVGALYMVERDGSLRVRQLGCDAWTPEDVQSFFGHEAFLREVMSSGSTTSLPATTGDDEAGLQVLARCGATSALIVPFVHVGRPLGALFMTSRDKEFDEDWRIFVQGVGNQITQALAIVRTFAEKEEAERVAREQAALLRLVLDSTAEGVVVADRQGKLMLVNPQARDMLGVTDDWRTREVLHLPDQVTPVPWEDLPHVRAVAGKKTDVELYYGRPGSSEGRWLRVSGRPLATEESAMQGGVVVIRDVTEQHRAAQEVLESRAQWRALVEHAPDIILNVDRGGIVRFMNRPLPGKSLDDLIGSSWYGLSTPDTHERMRQALEIVLTTGEPSRCEVRTEGPDGAAVWYSAHLGPIRKNDEITGAVVIAHDITHKKLTEAQLIVSDRMASIGALAAGVAHEINNPLAVVIANLELAYKQALELATRQGLHELADEIRDAREAADRVRLIVQDLKIFSRAEEERRGPVDVEDVLESTLRMAWNEVRHRARLYKRYGGVPHVTANESRLGQVFLNLIVNAAQAIPEGRAEHNEIVVETRTEGGLVAIEISDTGTGMTPEVMARLFTPFFTTKPVGVGTGLGLSICQRIISGLGGEIRVKSEPGRGSSFTVVLPEAKPAEPRRSTPRPTAPPSGRRGRVLVIDDEPMVARSIQRTLAREHEVLAVLRAQDALERLRAGERYDVILCDLMMPQMTGMDLYEELARELPDAAERVVFLTGGAFTVRAREFLDQVPNVRITKPFDAQLLRSVVNERVG